MKFSIKDFTLTEEILNGKLQILLLSKRLQTKKETDQNQPNQQLHVQS